MVNYSDGSAADTASGGVYFVEALSIVTTTAAAVAATRSAAAPDTQTNVDKNDDYDENKESTIEFLFNSVTLMDVSPEIMTEEELDEYFNEAFFDISSLRVL